MIYQAATSLRRDTESVCRMIRRPSIERRIRINLYLHAAAIVMLIGSLGINPELFGDACVWFALPSHTHESREIADSGDLGNSGRRVFRDKLGPGPLRFGDCFDCVCRL